MKALKRRVFFNHGSTLGFFGMSLGFGVWVWGFGIRAWVEGCETAALWIPEEEPIPGNLLCNGGLGFGV